MQRIIDQKRGDKDKLYSLHEPEVKCISKGKAGKRYAFGCKASIVYTQQTGVIVGAMAFSENPYDRHTLAEVLHQVERFTGRLPRSATVDRGYRGKQQVGSTQIELPHPPKKRDSAYQKQKKRKRFRRRAAIEPVISHLKHDHRAIRNYLKGHEGDSINMMMAAAALNFKRLMKKLRSGAFLSWLKKRHIALRLLLCKWPYPNRAIESFEF